MTRLHSPQSTFNAGVIDPRLAARTDLDTYFKGVDTGVNVLTAPQGGLKRRPGMAYQASLTAKSRVVEFSFNTEQNYAIVFSNTNIAVYLDGVKQADISSPYLEADLFELNYTQSADTMIITHADYETRTLVRQGKHTLWSLDTVTFTNIPQFGFGKNFPALSITPAATSGAGVTLTASADWFASGDIGATIAGNSGVATIATYVSPTEVTINISTPFADTAAIASGNWSFDMSTAGTSTEDVISARRGWFKTVTFHEQRLWFGGSGSKPNSIFGSQVGDFYNLDIGTGLDDEGIFVTMDTNQVNEITAMVSSRHLQIFTTGGEFYISSSPIQPGNISAQNQSKRGASSTVRPVDIDGATLFISSNGKALREFVFRFEEDAYTSEAASLMAPHLLNAPVDLAALRGTETEDADYIFVVNGDGSMAVYNTLRRENVRGWTHWQTNGTIESVAVIGTEVYFVVQRTINTVATRFLEKMDPETYTDCNIKQTFSPAQTAITGLAHLNGEECRVRADGSVMLNATPSGGSITLSRAGSEVEVGLNFDPLIKTMPLNVGLQNGTRLAEKKRITRASVNLYESLGVYLNSSYLADRQFGSNILDQVPDPYTGYKHIGFMGWDIVAQVIITQVDPLPLHLLGIVLRVEA